MFGFSPGSNLRSSFAARDGNEGCKSPPSSRTLVRTPSLVLPKSLVLSLLGSPPSSLESPSTPGFTSTLLSSKFLLQSCLECLVVAPAISVNSSGSLKVDEGPESLAPGGFARWYFGTSLLTLISRFQDGEVREEKETK
ncbi:hypothetical protein L484_014010 [Morus notabilis]|uniref:Uncharacterized protein n=1 Tax=Morus notabilis TaxID=981085 RepID=W9RBP5_9ROSA|nr:hypothetical protein L484_014010 [Morus notabilis]